MDNREYYNTNEGLLWKTLFIIVQRKPSSILQRFETNVRNLKEYLGSETAVIAVVKADGYGHGEVEVAQATFEAGAEMVSVATPDEAVRLRVAGISGDILVMGPSPLVFAEKAAELGIILTVSSAEWLQVGIRRQ